MKFLLSTLLIASFLLGCENDLVNIDNFKENIIFTESFENNKQPTDENWIVSSNLASFTASTPDNGGTWALELEPDWAPQEGYAERYITVQSEDWKQIIITETFSTQPEDKILVKLSAGMTEVANWKAVFDLVKLEKISD